MNDCTMEVLITVDLPDKVPLRWKSDYNRYRQQLYDVTADNVAIALAIALHAAPSGSRVVSWRRQDESRFLVKVQCNSFALVTEGAAIPTVILHDDDDDDHICPQCRRPAEYLGGFFECTECRIKWQA